MISSLRLRLERPSAIAALRAGAAVVEGCIVADVTLSLAFAPLPAVTAEWWIESHRRAVQGRRRPMWIAVDGGARVAPFWLEDATGRVRVAVEAASLRVFAARRDVGPVRDHRGRRWVARWIGAGDRVRVRGVATASAEGFALVGSPERPLEILRRG